MPQGIYVVNRVSDEPVPQIVSQKRNCQFCSEAVWIDPDKYAATSERGDLTIICGPCYKDGRHEQAAEQAAAEAEATEMEPDEEREDGDDEE